MKIKANCDSCGGSDVKREIPLSATYVQTFEVKRKVCDGVDYWVAFEGGRPLDERGVDIPWDSSALFRKMRCNTEGEAERRVRNAKVRPRSNIES